MKTLTLTIIILLTAVVTCYNQDAKATVEQFTNDEFKLKNDGSGSYTYSFKTSNGIQREEIGSISKALDGANGELIVRGSYSYLGPDGILYTVRYVADGNGFQPEGDHIKVPPSPFIPSPGSRKPVTPGPVKNLVLVEPEDKVYHFPAAALASLAGANIG